MTDFPASHRDLLEGQCFATLATFAASGYPQVTAVSFFFDEQDQEVKLSLNETQEGPQPPARPALQPFPARLRQPAALPRDPRRRGARARRGQGVRGAGRRQVRAGLHPARPAGRRASRRHVAPGRGERRRHLRLIASGMASIPTTQSSTTTSRACAPREDRQHERPPAAVTPSRPPSPRHKVPDADAGRPRSRCHSSHGMHVAEAGRSHAAPPR
jgi:hypothetical protein